MIELASIEAQLHSLNDWIVLAGKSLRHFYNENKGVFWRNTFQINRDRRVHPTSTNRSFFALYEYLRFLSEEDSKEDSPNEVCKILKGVSEKYLSLLPQRPDYVRQSKTNEINMFTDSHLLLSVSILKGLQRSVRVNVDIAKIMDAAKPVYDKNLKLLQRWKGGKMPYDKEVHDFVTLHMVRGLDAYSIWEGALPVGLNKLADRVKEDALRLLSYHFAGVSSKYDPSELGFCVALLNRFRIPDTPLLTISCIRSITESQAQDGAWPTSRYISYEGRGMLHVSSYEIALTLTHLLCRKIHQRNIELCEIVLPALNRTFDLVKSNFNMVGAVSGWSNDHTRRLGLIESWATATVLSFLINYHDFLVQLRQQLILEQHNPIYPTRSPVVPAWPDMAPLFRQADWMDLSQLNLISDPTDNEELTERLRSLVVRPVADDWLHRPLKPSIILYGPPGTGKTTLVIRLASALEWPVLILSPSDFLGRGLEGFEATTAKIFDDLLRLRRTVVLLDDCEEFFKVRPKKPKIESRTIGAFITSGMLSRLQRLHDRKWVVFLVATNSKLKELDDAVTRPGRFDYAQEISYPCLTAQMRYLQKKMNNVEKIIDIVKIALEQYDQNRKGDSKAGQVSFTHLDRLIEGINKMQKPTAKGIYELLKNLVKEKYPPPLVQPVRLKP